MKNLLPTQLYQPDDGGRQKPKRLVFLMPGVDVDEVKFSWAVRKLAAPGNLDVLLLSVVHDVENELAARRNLVTICALVDEYKYHVEFKVVWNRSWIKAVKTVAAPGDLFICPPEVTVRTGLRKREPLDAAIASRLNVPTQPLPNFFSDPRGIPNFFNQALFWTVVVAIIAGFFVLESNASQVATGTVGHILIILLMVFEFGVIYAWMALTG
jgi:hypothetical protein